jgi:inner membrane protein
VDNLAHALAGAALGRAGLSKQTGLGVATLVIAANLPDVDAVSGLFGRSLAWRRGWTHGPIALIVLPIFLALAMVAFDRWQAGRGSRPDSRLPVRAWSLLALAYIGILSHPILDLLNAYGVRFLMPFSERWFYGDALFIIDIWVWSAFALGIFVSRRRERRGDGRTARPAVVALIAVAVYAGAMTAASAAAERFVAREVVARGMRTPLIVVANPVPIDPFRRRIVFDTGEAFGIGNLRWTPAPRLTLEPGLVATNMNHPAIARATARDQRVADFLYWSRLPFADVQTGPDGVHVTIGDARYNRRPGEGFFTVRARVEGKAE